ncbi:ogr/Delta-like zinc finger family protein [Pantoea agglomerans]|uniref:Ogr/Delta-like zinc finger family protein n=1 Tax=Enterobacter agglomerans TaxID=549 RepID=A0ACC5RKG9_ENTAG|nr:ogr/Delta-like zinc finger family protein [Pantoea agglomerans]MBK4725066.1 ogr/Delta-like zinc finger family protein [Pantoea agglomerans]
MMPCPICQHNSHARSSRILSSETKERYHQCQNLNCSCTFKSMESITGIVARPLEATPPPVSPVKTRTSRLGS